MPKKRLTPKPNIHTFLGQIIFYLERERKKIPISEVNWVKENECALNCAHYLKGFFTPKRFVAYGCPDGWPRICKVCPPTALRVRRAKR